MSVGDALASDRVVVGSRDSIAVTRGLHEALEERLDLVVEQRVLERDAGLRGERREQLLGALVERDDAVARSRVGRSSWIRPFALLLMSWMTPMTSSRAEIIGTVSIERVW